MFGFPPFLLIKSPNIGTKTRGRNTLSMASGDISQKHGRHGLVGVGGRLSSTAWCGLNCLEVGNALHSTLVSASQILGKKTYTHRVSIVYSWMFLFWFPPCYNGLLNPPKTSGARLVQTHSDLGQLEAAFLHCVLEAQEASRTALGLGINR